MKIKVSIIFVIIILVGINTSTTTHAQTVLTGSTDAGAFFKIAVPDNWNGDLVIANHGISMDPPGPNPDLGPLAPLQLAEGYAVAASSYQQNGWALFKTKVDMQHLLNSFKENFGQPVNIWITGGSMGGLVTVEAIEKANLGNIVGGYTFCGALAGSRGMDMFLDLRLVYDAVCEDVPDAYIPGGAEGLPEGFPFTPSELALAVHACTGILFPPESRTPDQANNLAQIIEEINISENLLLNNMNIATFGLSDLVHAKGKLNGKIATGNVDVLYDDPFIDAAIARVSPSSGASNRFEKHYTPTGQVGSTKIVSLHTDKDDVTVVENESEYAALVFPENLTTAIVVESEPSHCGFSPSEIVAGWEALRFWIAGGPQPTAATIQILCETLEPTFGGPCRIDPFFVVPDMDERVHPR